MPLLKLILKKFKCLRCAKLSINEDEVREHVPHTRALSNLNNNTYTASVGITFVEKCGKSSRRHRAVRS